MTTQEPPTAEGLSLLSPAACAQLHAAQLPHLPLRGVAFVHPKQRAQLRDADAFLARAHALLHDGVSCVDALAVQPVPAGHAAHPGYGLFARAALRCETLLSEYGGDLLAEEECDARDPLPDGSRNTCMFGVCVSEDAEMDIDGTPQPRALAAYVNDYTGIAAGSDTATGFTQEALRAAGVNTRFMEVLCGGGCLCKGGAARQPGVVHPHLLMYTIADVAPEQELLTLYGAAYWRVHDAALQAGGGAHSDTARSSAAADEEQRPRSA